MKSKLLNISLLVSSLCGFLEWGKDNRLFLFQAEAEVISKLFVDPLSVIHPFTLLPLIGQILLIVTLFQKKPSPIITYISIGGLGILLGLMFVIGIISFNLKILFSTIPFFTIALVTIRYHRTNTSLSTITTP